MRSLPKVAFGVSVAVFWAVMMVALHNVFPADGDMVITLSRWWSYVAEHGFNGIATVGTAEGADYTSIWYFIIFLANKAGVYPRLPLWLCLKGLSIAGTIVASVAVFFVVKTVDRKPGSWRPLIAASLLPFLPAFFLDTFKTNMADSIYLAIDLLALLALLRRRPILAWFLLGISMSFKLMAIYVVPFLMLLYLVRFAKMDPLQRLAPVAAPLGVLLMGVPGLLSGQTLFDATIGPWVERSGDVGSAGGVGWGIWRVLFAPSWPWMPDVESLGVGAPGVIPGGTIFGLCVIVIVLVSLIALLLNARDSAALASGSLDLLIASPLLFFLFLPVQHEGYFALAVVFATLAFVLSWSRQSLIVLAALGFILLETYEGCRVFQPIVYEFLLLGLLVYFCSRIFTQSKLHLVLRDSAPMVVES